MKPEARILHITNWYPNTQDTIEAQFIKDQIDALNDHIPSDVVMLQIRKGAPKILMYQASSRELIWIFQLPIGSWFVIEILTSALLFIFLLLKFDQKKYVAVNFHIAYPLLTYFHLFKNLIRLPVIISEHWSAYHFNFGVKKELPRIKKIFRHQSNLITVSRSLADDIINFSGCKQLRTFFLPNTVNEMLFYPHDSVTDANPRFFMLGCWQYPKEPWIVIEALKVLKEKGFKFQMKIGGYGPYEERLKQLINTLALHDCVEYIGKQTFEQGAHQMKQSSHFLHASNYETFSLVCAEALCCGTPVIASKVGGIPDFVVESHNGILVKENNIAAWAEAVKGAYTLPFERFKIADEAIRKFSKTQVGKQYYAIIKEIVN